MYSGLGISPSFLDGLLRGRQGSRLRGSLSSSTLVACLGLLLACQDPDGPVVHESQLIPTLEHSVAEVDDRAAESEAHSDVIGRLIGEWSTVGHSCPGICAMSNEEADSWIGLKATLTEVGVVFGDDSCRDATYESRRVSRLDFYRSSRFDLEQLGILQPDVEEVTVSCAGEGWIAPGSLFLIKDEETLITPWDGVYFELARARSE